MPQQSDKPVASLSLLLADMNLMYGRRSAREKSIAQQRYRASLIHNASTILDIARRGTLEECLDAVNSILGHDLEYLAKTDEHKEAILQHMKNFREARNNFDALKSRPNEYRRQAAGYIDDYKIGGVIPKDGMHGALRSYAGHLKSRDSQYLAAEETGFIDAQKTLVAEITKRYIALQKKTLRMEK